MSLIIKNLSKCYGNLKALSNVNLDFDNGIYGLIGPNGAGKSTLIKLITDNIKRDKNSGEILWNGVDILKLGREFRKIVGYMPQQQAYYPHMSVVGFLKYMAEIKEIDRKTAKVQIDNLLHLTNLTDVRHKKIASLSGGMKQRVVLCQALLGAPKVLILDEPTAGLDPKERIAFRNIITGLSAEKIIIIATHIVSDVECLAKKVLILEKGIVVSFSTPKELISELNGKVAEIKCELSEADKYRADYALGDFRRGDDGFYLRLVQKNNDFNNDFPEGAVILKENLNLEDVYLHYFYN